MGPLSTLTNWSIWCQVISKFQKSPKPVETTLPQPLRYQRLKKHQEFAPLAVAETSADIPKPQWLFRVLRDPIFEMFCEVLWPWWVNWATPPAGTTFGWWVTKSRNGKYHVAWEPVMTITRAPGEPKFWESKTFCDRIDKRTTLYN